MFVLRLLATVALTFLAVFVSLTIGLCAAALLDIVGFNEPNTWLIAGGFIGASIYWPLDRFFDRIVWGEE